MDKLNIEELRKYYPNLDIEKIPLLALKRLAYKKAYQKSDKCKAYKKAYYQKKKLLKGVIKGDNWEGWQKQEERVSRKVINNG